MKIYRDDDRDAFDPPQFTGVAGLRFEPMYSPEWRTWCIIDRELGRLHRCEDRGSAIEEAASLEFVRRIVEHVAEGFRWN